jgi:hypothetical protein
MQREYFVMEIHLHGDMFRTLTILGCMQMLDEQVFYKIF